MHVVFQPGKAQSLRAIEVCPSASMTLRPLAVKQRVLVSSGHPGSHGPISSANPVLVAGPLKYTRITKLPALKSRP